MNATSRPLMICALASLLMTACGSSPPVRYFSLSPTVAATGPEAGDTIALGLGPIRMAEYLNRSQLVTRGPGQEIIVDEFNRWAEPLSPAFHRIVSTDVDNAVDGLVVVAFPWESAVRGVVDYRLLGDVARFDADRGGRVVLEVQWGVVEIATGQRIIRPQRAQYLAQARSADDPASVASAMNEALAAFSRDVAGRMEAVVDDQP